MLETYSKLLLLHFLYDDDDDDDDVRYPAAIRCCSYKDLHKNKKQIKSYNVFLLSPLHLFYRISQNLWWFEINF